MNSNRNAGEDGKQLYRFRYLRSVMKLHGKVSVVGFYFIVFPYYP